jgi:NitT/TauT family transport system substrate-binding protein
MKKMRLKHSALRSLRVTEIGLLLFLSLAASLAHAQSLPAVRISFSAPSGMSTPAWMAKELGLFEKYGLNGSIIYIGGGTLPMSVLLAGDTEFTMVVGPPAVLARLNGADSTILATFANKLTMSFVAHPSIRQPRELQRKRIGITRFGAATDYAAKLALKSWGLTPKDVEIVQTGGIGEAYAALKAGLIQATVFSPPLSTQAIRSGMVELLDFSRSDIQFVNNSLVSTTKYVQQKPEATRDVLRALIEGVWAFKADRERGIKVLQKYSRVQDRRVLEDTYEFYSRILLDVPTTTEAGLSNILETLSESQPKARTAAAKDFFIPTFTKELENTGFFKQLATRYLSSVR